MRGKETVQKNAQDINLMLIPTCDLVTEIKKREGVNHFCVEPYQLYAVKTESMGINDEGPAVILVVTD